MATVYRVLTGYRYIPDQQAGIRSTFDAARLLAVTLTFGEEQDPPAEGTMASWLDADLNYVCIVADEVT
jgi:hypothetical protein